jgi:hypothetical protein
MAQPTPIFTSISEPRSRRPSMRRAPAVVGAIALLAFALERLL